MKKKLSVIKSKLKKMIILIMKILVYLNTIYQLNLPKKNELEKFENSHKCL